MKIRNASREDLDRLCEVDHHISRKELEISISLGHVSIAEEDGVMIGWMRYNMFWDNTPFLNMLYLLEGDRGKGYGKKMMEDWEKRMKQSGFSCVMTSTASDEYAQHFYVKLGYKAVGGFTYGTDPYEIIFMKKLG